MKNPFGALGNIFGGHQHYDLPDRYTNDYENQHWAGDPEWRRRQQEAMMQHQNSAMENQILQQQRQQQQQYYQQKQYIAEPPSLDPELQMTQALVLLFGEHWELINEQLKKLSDDEPDPSSSAAINRSMAGQKMW